MLLNKVYNRDVVTVAPETTVEAAARCMAERHIGALVVVEDRTPVGIVTDRDLVVRALARRCPPTQTAVREVMTAKPICVSERTTLASALEQMRFYRIRRLVVTNDVHEVIGIVSLDDMAALVDAQQRALHTVTEVLHAGHQEALEGLPASERS
jgi:CBS domain-containing protein